MCQVRECVQGNITKRKCYEIFEEEVWMKKFISQKMPGNKTHV